MVKFIIKVMFLGTLGVLRLGVENVAGESIPEFLQGMYFNRYIIHKEVQQNSI